MAFDRVTIMKRIDGEYSVSFEEDRRRFDLPDEYSPEAQEDTLRYDKKISVAP